MNSRRFKLYDNYSTWFSLSDVGEFRLEFQVQKKERIIIVSCSDPSQNDIRNIVSRSSTTTVKIYTPISIKVAPVKHDP